MPFVISDLSCIVSKILSGNSSNLIDLNVSDTLFTMPFIIPANAPKATPKTAHLCPDNNFV